MSLEFLPFLEVNSTFVFSQGFSCQKQSFEINLFDKNTNNDIEVRQWVVKAATGGVL